MQYLVGAFSMLILLMAITIIGVVIAEQKRKKDAADSFKADQFIYEIKKFKPREGDTIVVRTMQRVGDNLELKEKIKESTRGTFGLDPNFKIVLLDDGQDIEILRSNSPAKEGEVRG